jgi:hypothetical protein
MNPALAGAIVFAGLICLTPFYLEFGHNFYFIPNGSKPYILAIIFALDVISGF